MGKIAFVFPGQGSQAVGMGKAVAERHESAKVKFQQADKRLGYALSSLIAEGPIEELTQTKHTQPALVTTSMAILELFKEENITPDYVAGHSLGEYAALVAAGAISFEDAVYAVHKRGEYMEQAVPNGEGSMAAILGLDRQKLKEITDQITQEGHAVQLANMNCPGQIVISGSAKGVALASEQAKEAGAKRALPLQVSGPFHSALMKPAADKFQGILNEISIQDADIPVVINVTADVETSAANIQQKLIEQLYSPVLWEDTVNKLIELGVDTFVEVGPGKVLSGLVKKTSKEVKIYSVQDPESFQAFVEDWKK